MSTGPVGGRLLFVSDGGAASSALLAALRACSPELQQAKPVDAAVRIDELAPDVVVVDLRNLESPFLAALKARLPVASRLIGIGTARAIPAPDATPIDCLLAAPDEATLRSVLAGPPAIDLGNVLDELLRMSVFGNDLPATFTALAGHVARAFEADDCMVMLTHADTCYTSRPISEEALGGLVPLCESVSQSATGLIAPQRSDHPYRSFLGVPLSHLNAPPIAMLLLCRTRPIPFHRDTLRHLRALSGRLATDLAWRLVQERLSADRDKVRDVPRIDPVLGVANHTALQEELPNLVSASERAGEPFSVAIIDVDGLCLINERSGYPAGDAVLEHIAQTARRRTRPVDLVARYAGDSVAVALPGVSTTDATSILTQILSEIDANPVVHEDKAINLTVSAGIAELKYDEETGELALARAMAARRTARLHGEVIAVATEAEIADAPVQADFAIGTTLGGVYQIRHEISRGAFGVVYRAQDMALGRQVALKLLRPDLASDTAFVERFRAEAATLARIRNPNLVQVYAFGANGTDVFFAMELVEGQALDERIELSRRRMRHLPLPEVLGVIDEIASALEAVHQAGMLHRDVKPENVLVDRVNKRCVLVDVGIAVRRGGEKNPAGTPGFTAPEVFGSGDESPATDVYGLGALAYLLLTLQVPFAGTGSLDILSRQMRRPAPPTELRTDLPRGVDEVLLPALDPDPAQRPQSARAFAKRLSEALEQSVSPSGRARPRMTLEPPIVRRPTPIRNASVSVTPAPQIARRHSSGNSVPSEPSTRGIMFRSVYEILGARRGGAWIAELKRNVPELALALGPQSSALAWHPTDAFIEVLKSLSADAHQARTAAMQLGRAAAASSFGQFYGADTSSITPAQALRAADTFWRAYHNWGAASVDAGERDARVVITDGISNALLCASTSGLLAGVIGHAKGRGVRVEHRTCVAADGEQCVFELAWVTARRGQTHL